MLNILKRALCLTLALLMLILTVSCGGTGAGEETTDTPDVPQSDDSTDEKDTEDEKKEFVDTYDGVFQVGYSRVEITPDLPIPLNTGTLLTSVKEPLYATCVAVHDGKNTALLISLDVKNVPDDEDEAIKYRLKVATKVPEKNIMINAMHNHSAPCVGIPGGDPAIQKWTAKVYSYVVTAAKEAIADLSDAEIYMGVAKTTNYAFVRRYIHEDGSFSSIHYRNASKTPIVKHETDADDNAQIIRMVRADKKDVILTNWQAHAAHAITIMPTTVSADYVHYIREGIEKKDDDALVAFFCGASGNINTTVRIQELNVTLGHYKRVGELVAEAIVKQLDNLERIQEGKIYSDTTTYIADAREVSADYVKKAKEIQASGAEGSDAYNKLLDKYGFKSSYEVNRAISLGDAQGTTSKLLLGAISFGDLSFISVPYEMFDTNGMEVKDGSPFEMTFILTMAGGCSGYVPSALAVKNGGYEVYQSHFRYGTAEEAVAEYLKMLNDLFEKKNK